jgi:TolB-like protein/Tfp pilus assembly protein PilF
VDEQTYLVAELLDGETLRARIVRGGISPDEARRIALDVARGLAAAHDAGLVHRDLKPENIFLTHNGQTKLLDFGIAKLTQDEAVPEGASTLTGVVLGTAGYLAPEQIRGDAVDGRADLFAFGAVLFEMITGERAFVRDQIVDTLHAILHDPPASTLEHSPGVPTSLATIVARLLEKAPAARFQSAAELIAALERADVGRTRAWPVRQVARMRAVLRRPVGKAAAAAMVVAAISAGVLLWDGWSAPAIRSIAVLPFETNDSKLDYIGTGMTEGLIDRLSRIPELRVPPLATSSRFKGEDPLTAAAALRVDAVVRGEVSQRGTQLVVSAELKNGATGRSLWGPQELVGAKAELIKVQGSILLNIVKRLGLQLSTEEQARGPGTNSPEAYDLYLEGRSLLESDLEEDVVKAREFFGRATDKDPNYLKAYLALAGTYLRSIGEGYAAPLETELLAQAALAKAAAIDPNNVAVRVAKAHLRWTVTATPDWRATDQEYRAVKDDPALLRTTAYQPVALFFAASGKWPEAVDLLRRALDDDPGNQESQAMLGRVLLQAQHLDEARVVFEALRTEAPQDPRPWFGLAEYYKRSSVFPRAAEMRARAHALEGDEDAEREFKWATTEGRYAKAEKTFALAELERLELQSTGYIHPFDRARLYAQSGNREQALTWLETAATVRGHVELMLLKEDPTWTWLRNEKRFLAVVLKLGIP